MRDPIERLARDICWAGFLSPAAIIGKTRASYWKSLPEDTRESYRMQATEFAWLLERLPSATLTAVRKLQSEHR